MPEDALAGKVAVVTGGGRGIGRALALALADAGADVAVASRTGEEVASVAEEIRERGRQALDLGSHSEREEFDINIPDDAAEKITTVGQAIEFIDKSQEG